MGEKYDKKAIIDGLLAKGVEVTSIDLSIAEVITSLAEQTAIKAKKDYDGYVVDELVGFVHNPQVATLISSFPSAALYLLNNEDAVGLMVEAYLRNGYVHCIYRYFDDEPYKEKMIYASKEEYEQEKMKYGEEYDSRLSSSKFSSLPSDQVRDEFTIFSIRELKRIEKYNQFVETNNKGRKIN